MTEPEEFTASCQWCHVEVVSVVGPPHMFEVANTWPGAPVQQSVWTICMECEAELIKLIASRDWQSHAPDR